MIVSQKISFRRIFWTLGTPLFSLGLLSVVVTIVHHLYPRSGLWVSPLPFTVAGAALSIFLAFRNNAAYDRYWEGRGLWGRLVNYSRSFNRQLITYLREDSGSLWLYESGPLSEREQFIRQMSYRLIGFVHALRHHLRGGNAMLELQPFLPSSELAFIGTKRNIPNAILLSMGEQLGVARRKGWLDSIQLSALDTTLTEFANIQGSCERIRNTPLPPTYTLVTDRVVLIYCGLLPLGLVTELGIITPVIVTIISFAFLVLTRISSLLENPFGLRSNDLPLTALSRTIEIDVRQALAETSVPDPVEPVNGILL
jgi:ion channel-forming bestrophin family protein